MDSVGAEVGQKMRSAIKAKLLELNCYVDDELPDYIMVMVANRRTKAQMKEDLNLFLNTKTEVFVDWLHIVLKKLREVTVTNPDVYKRVTKRKANEEEDVKVKKEKKSKKTGNNDSESTSSLTDNLPMMSKKLTEQRKLLLENKNEEKYCDEFDIPLLSEVNKSNERELEEIERRIKSVKSRLGSQIIDDAELVEAKLEKGLEEINEQTETNNEFAIEKPRKHSPIIFQEDKPEPPPVAKKVSILQRLGERKQDSQRKRESSEAKKKDERHSRRRVIEKDDRKQSRPKDRIRHAVKDRKDSESQKNLLSQVGVMSKIYVPEKPPVENEEDELKTREVRSMVRVKPRILPSNATQPNKALLLKAVEEAHRSVSQTTKNVKVLNTEENSNGDVPITRKLSHREKVKLRNIILAQVSREDSDSNDDNDKEFEYVPKPLTKTCKELPAYIPSSRNSVDGKKAARNCVLVTSESDYSPEIIPEKPRISAKARLEARKSPSPIIYDKASIKVTNKPDVPDILPIIHQPISLKNKEKCKYWPNCRQGEKCEFVHPVVKCELFPNCQYGDSCLYIHPSCKFGPGCTKRGCSFSHSSLMNKTPLTQPVICKYFPKCSYSACSFYHPKPCRFGQYCKNQADCPFSHATTVNKASLTWRSQV
ncbi:unnamed protein product [Phyllotreta striolata]|uniref:Zinc finger CCCH domain-containing protein 14 n=1 Tax=Phyllotreta striolata TaxID=444603 RepID=A0A9N9XPC5_PHYSR|nr:unnamed protein product [Phyllotreta striolata]